MLSRKTSQFGISAGQLGKWPISWKRSTSSNSRSYLCSTLRYIAPEIYTGKSYRYEVDMFAFGVLLFRLLSGERPFPSNNSQILKRHTIELRYNVQGEDWENVSSSAKDLVRKLLINRRERLTAERALRHKWFSEIGESVLRPDRSTTRSHQDTSRSRAVVLVSTKIPEAIVATSLVHLTCSTCNGSRIRLKRLPAQWNEATEADFGLMVKWR